MTGVEYDICRTQQKIYEYMSKQGYDMQVFSNEYLSSDFCRRYMDTSYSRFQLEFPMECADFYMPEIEHKLKKNENGAIFNLDVAGWIGFTYRQLYIKTKIDSRKLAELVSFSDMCSYYAGLHTIDEENAVDIIICDHIKRKGKEGEKHEMCIDA